MYKVKLTPYRPILGKIMYRQTKDGTLTSQDGRYRFYINEDVDNPDFWVVQGKGLRNVETCHVAPENTIVLTTEPRSVLIYPNDYLKQFGMVCTCQQQTRHPNIHFGPAILPWFVGYHRKADGNYAFTHDYNSFKTDPAPEKTKLISVITSSKAFTAGHIKRIKFVEKLKEYYGDKLDVFGHGFNDFADKWDVLSPYKYHIVIENSSQDYYWTEKLSDCFLCDTYPLYYGCTNIDEYFPKDSMTLIDIDDFEKTVAAIDRVIAEDTYSKSQEALAESKRLVLDKFNMFEYIASLCDTLNPEAPRKEVTLKPCHSMHEIHNFWNYLVVRAYYKLKMRIIDAVCGNRLKKGGERR